MRCKYVRERAIENWLTGGAEVPPGLRVHLESCPACAGEVHRARIGYAAVRSLPPVEPPGWLQERVLARIFAPEETTVARIPLVRRPAFALAAAATVLLAVAATTTVVSLPRGKTAEYSAAVNSVAQSGLRDDVRLLRAAPWVAQSSRLSMILARVELVLEEVANAHDRPSRVGEVARLVRETNLVENLHRVAVAAPEHDRARVLRISLQLEEIANL